MEGGVGEGVGFGEGLAEGVGEGVAEGVGEGFGEGVGVAEVGEGVVALDDWLPNSAAAVPEADGCAAARVAVWVARPICPACAAGLGTGAFVWRFS